MKLVAAIVIGATLISVAIIFGDRYEMVPIPRGGVWRVDSLTGQLSICEATGARKVQCYDRDGPIRD